MSNNLDPMLLDSTGQQIVTKLEAIKTAIQNGGGGGGGTTVIANPSGSATADLEKLQVGSTIYGIPEIEANPSGTASTNLTALKVNETIYNIPSGSTNVVANPSGAATADLQKLQVGNDIYNIPSGGGGGTGAPTGDLLWEGTFQGSGSIQVPNIDDYFLIGVQNDVNVIMIGSKAYGCGGMGLYQSGGILTFCYRFDSGTAGAIGVTANDHGIIRSNNSGINTYNSGEWCTIKKIWGLFKKPVSS